MAFSLRGLVGVFVFSERRVYITYDLLRSTGDIDSLKDIFDS